MEMGNEHRVKIRLWLVLGFVVSIALLVTLHEPLHEVWWGQLMIKGLEAIAIASVIGIVLEEALLREFGREVFLASVGYVLPVELRPEMSWLCQLNEMCTQDVMICELTPVGNSIKLHVNRTQVVKNIGRNTHKLPVGLGIDEWFRDDGESRIIKFSFVTAGQSWSYYAGSGKPQKSEFGMNLPADLPDVLLEKDQEVNIVSEFEEIYPRNGYFHMHIKYATSGAKVTVKCPDELGVYVQFAHREGHETLQVGHDFVCPFTLLPYQRMAVRFWDKKQSETWKSQAT